MEIEVVQKIKTIRKVDENTYKISYFNGNFDHIKKSYLEELLRERPMLEFIVYG